MEHIVINGDVWGVLRVPAGDSRLVDRTNTERLATTNPYDRTIYIRADLEPPTVDNVVMHEVAHAIQVSWGLLDELYRAFGFDSPIRAEEWSARLMENHAIEAVQLSSEILGRPVCIRGECRD